ncbi:hypothetical protein A3A54_01945 [Candidatus Curtissbacteria bacterium RIFCSPLOWO2_01_FULL_39_62]|uniref:Uncharacterized protein n=3 Tax=Candidatus Curtissiibacteriota TaxID=1752717 RepID=A0A1F5GAB0_9BACT|nr:MAG: hypothetical protein A2775_00750 [Candidatus Curtissbacteria bacterium RIFCSPHIGHO2_01_FULL_39_57]OGD88774.1 MAG: hypothetical protein A3D04_04420 [Candidatus Curtissbacteria bacterium RIFCSPHIGHO2_02_FULL_40_16b]OGD90528.1 MAG: hypothetical protein A3E11_02640 [Candidatus Curtissbacteria bacterium RIFCSPHIGHO2_12_FULL_38_37]OGD98877.1 MAG: hypothetical protein A2W45_01525 [Candidatus Curtissbacteria bacterium RIFCSPHIGHO2_12_41_11]OGD99723.1 MAG: hypothetical protein A3J17_00195 [Candi
MPALPKLPSLPVVKILIYFFTVVFALASGIAAGTILFKAKNPDAQINLYGTVPSPTPVPSPIIQRSPSPIPSPTGNVIPDDWLTYTNEILGFEFSYPPDVTIEEADLRGDSISGSLISPAEFTYAVSAKFNDTELVYIASSVNVQSDYLPVDPKAAAEALKAENEVDGEDGLQMTIVETALGENKAYKVESTNNPLLVYFVLSSGKDETSEISISTIAEKTRAQTVEQIIRSFKFLE